MTTEQMREPTSEECSANAPYECNGRKGFAAWYPQMGGYVGRCVVLTDCRGIITPEGAPGDCFDVLVWHDGEFPFAEDDTRDPARLHHCDPAQFIAFGALVRDMFAKATRLRAKVDAEGERFASHVAEGLRAQEQADHTAWLRENAESVVVPEHPAVALLRTLEWSGVCQHTGADQCMACHSTKAEGHDSDCRLAAILASSKPGDRALSDLLAEEREAAYQLGIHMVVKAMQQEATGETVNVPDVNEAHAAIRAVLAEAREEGRREAAEKYARQHVEFVNETSAKMAAMQEQISAAIARWQR